MKKILLIAHNNPIDPLGIMYLISNTTGVQFDVAFAPDDAKINFNKYDIIGFSTITGSHIFHNEIARLAKTENPDIITIMGGPHPTFSRKECHNLKYIDYICVGEGVLAFNKWVHDEDQNNIIPNNISYKYFGKLDPLCDINKINPPDRSIVYNINNRISNPIRNFVSIFGCPFNCAHCLNESYGKLYKNEPRVRYRDPKLFVDEIADCINKFGGKLIYTQDDTFIINKDWFKKTVNLIKDRVNLPYHCHIRANNIDEDVASMLALTNCQSVSFGIETASEDYRENHLNRRMANEQILNTAKLLHKYRIKFRIFNMVGLPFSHSKDDIDTIKLNAKCRPTIGWASFYQPYPSTVLGNESKQKNLWDGNIDTINPSYFDKSPLDLGNNKERERLQKLFSLAVGSLLARTFIKLLIKLPLDNWYKKMNDRFKDKRYKDLFV